MKLVKKKVNFFYNRRCPRTCPYCRVILKGDGKPMETKVWEKIFENLIRRLKTCFFMALGAEPLVEGNTFLEFLEMCEDIKRRHEDVYVVHYTAFPEPYFSRIKKDLVRHAGNLSTGLDFIPEVYAELNEKGLLSFRTKQIVEQYSDTEVLLRKSKDTLNAMKELVRLSEKIGTERLDLVVTITLSALNIELLPYMYRYLLCEFKGRVKVFVNCLHYRTRQIDFGGEKSVFNLSEGDRQLWEKTMKIIKEDGIYEALSPKGEIEYLDDWNKIVNLDWESDTSTCWPSIDFNGYLMRCAYSRGVDCGLYGKYDLTKVEHYSDDDLNKMLLEWESSLKGCKCYWVQRYVCNYEERGVRFETDREDWWAKAENKTVGLVEKYCH